MFVLKEAAWIISVVFISQYLILVSGDDMWRE